MKKIHLFGLLIVAAAVAIIMSTASDASTYVDFKEAARVAKENPQAKVHVVGMLKKDAQGRIVGMHYDPVVDANRLEFLMVDSLGTEARVIYNQPKPQDMDKSEKVVIVGNMQGDVFRCDKVLLKCPSKYNAQAPEGAKTAKL
jgi:cytochrome c-type biogenesis protein CcmE